MNNVFRRPMFRKGGSAGEGITSGLAPRQGYATNENNLVQQVTYLKWVKLIEILISQLF